MKYKIRNKFSKEERKLRFSYYDFISSDWWIKQKLDWYSRHKKRCARCRSEKNIHLHHKVYPKGGRYLSLMDNAFVALCDRCHFTFHKRNVTSQNMQNKSSRFIKELGIVGSQNEKLSPNGASISSHGEI